MEDLTIGAIWNMDEQKLKRIDELLTLTEAQFLTWDLDNLYWTLRGIRRQINSKLKKGSGKIDDNQNQVYQIDKKLKELEVSRKLYLGNKEKYKGNFFIKCEEFFMMMERLMKEHKLFFREGDDPRMAVLKR